MGFSPKLQLTDKILSKTFLRLIPKWVAPNHLTVLRFFMVTPVVWLFWQGKFAVGAIVFLIAAFTDALDGSLARSRNQVTGWGKVYDPLADKILIGAVVYILVAKYVDIYAAWVIIILETLLIVGAFIKHRNGGKVEANVWGKIKMFLQVVGVMVMLFAIIFDLETLLHISRGTFYLSIAFGIISLFTYSI